MQLSVPKISFNKVQTVEQIISTTTDIQTNDEEAVIVPSAVFATETAEGAALPATAAVGQSASGGLFSSPWFLGLLGVVALAGTAFIFI